MRFRLEASPEELGDRAKAEALVRSLRDYLTDSAADVLAKAMPSPEHEVKYPVLRELKSRASAEYERTLARIQRQVIEVINRPEAVKSEFPERVVFAQDPTDLRKGWMCGVCGATSSSGDPCEHVREATEELSKALYIGPRGGKWADPEHTIPWDPEKHGRQIGLFSTAPDVDRPEHEPDPRDVIGNDPALTEAQRKKPQSQALKQVARKIDQGIGPEDFDLPAGARIDDQWRMPDPDPDAPWAHPDYGSGFGRAPWHSEDWTPDLHEYDLVLINSSAGKDSQAMLSRIVEAADEQDYPRDNLLVVHADLGRVEWKQTNTLAEQQAKHYGLDFVLVQREQNDLVDQIEQRHGDLVQRERDVAALAEVGIRTWGDLHQTDPERILEIIGPERGESKWPGEHRAKVFHRAAEKKLDKMIAQRDKKAEALRKKIEKYDEKQATAGSVKAKQRAHTKYLEATSELEELERTGDPRQWPISFGKTIPWPSMDARYCTSDHKRAEIKKLITARSREFKEKYGRAPKILNSLGIRAQESSGRLKQASFRREETANTRVVDRWYPIHRWEEGKVWNQIADSGVPYHKAYNLGMRRLSCVFCVFASREDLLIAAVNNPDLFKTYLELEEKVGHAFSPNVSLAGIAKEIRAKRAEGYELDELAQWVKKALGLGDDSGDDLVKAVLQDSPVTRPHLVVLLLEAALRRLLKGSQAVVAVAIEWKSDGTCVHLETAAESHHVAYLEYPDAYNASLAVAAFAVKRGLELIEHNPPEPREDLEIEGEELTKALYIGPRGGRWADPQHTIPWRPEVPRRQMSLQFEPETRPEPPEEPGEGMSLKHYEQAIRGKPVEHLGFVIGDQVIYSRPGTRNAVPITVEALSVLGAQRVQNPDSRAIMTHNHPSQSVLSLEDMMVAAVWDFDVARAVCPDGTVYQVKKPGVGDWAATDAVREPDPPRPGSKEWPFSPALKQLQTILNSAHDRAIALARDDMDAHLLAIDSDAPLNEDHPGYSEEVWREKYSRRSIEEYNATLEREGYRWRIEVEKPRLDKGGDRLGQGSSSEVSTVGDGDEWIELSEEAGRAIWESLEKAGSRPHKYIRRVPYTDARGKRRYRYYYRESAAARGARAGETVRIGDRMVHVEEVADDGSITIREGDSEQTRTISADEWARELAGHYGDAFYQSAERRARQAVNAVLKHVPKKMLADLRGTTDSERMADLRRRVPQVYDRLQKAFRRAGVDAFEAKTILGDTLKRRGWAAEARAAAIGHVLTPEGARMARKYRVVLDAAENLAGGQRVSAEHATAAVGLAESNIDQVARRAEAELAKLNRLLTEAQADPTDMGKKAALLAGSIASKAVEQLNALKTAFPGLSDRAAPVARDTMLQVPAAAPSVSTEGAEAAVYVAGEGGRPQALRARYRLVEAREAIPSHDPMSFRPHEDYPEGLQERAYHRDKTEQAKVQRNATRMAPAFVMNTNPDAVNGPPLVTPEGVVLGGNSRTMSMQRIYEDPKLADKAEEMKQYLRDHAHEVGVDPAAVDQLDHPIVIREVDVEDQSMGNLKIMVRAMNETFTQALDPRTMQVAMGRRLPDEALQSLADQMEPTETLNKFLGTSRAKSFIATLNRAGIIDERNTNQYMRKGKLNADGKVMVARVLAGRVLDDADLLSETRPGLIESIAQSVPYMVQAAGAGEGYRLTDSVQKALDAYNRLHELSDEGTIKFALNKKVTDKEFHEITSSYLRDMFAGDHPALGDSRAIALLDMFIRRSGSQQMAKVFREYVDLARKNPESQAGLFGGGRSPEEIFHDAVRAARNSERQEQPKEKPKEDLLAASMSEREGQGFEDFTEEIAEQDQRAYQRVRKVLIRRGYREADFEQGGPLFGYSTNELIRLARKDDR